MNVEESNRLRGVCTVGGCNNMVTTIEHQSFQYKDKIWLGKKPIFKC